jgi:hypothetical protein
VQKNQLKQDSQVPKAQQGDKDIQTHQQGEAHQGEEAHQQGDKDIQAHQQDRKDIQPHQQGDKDIQAHQRDSKYLKHIKAQLSLKLSAGVLMMEPGQSSRVVMEDMLSLVQLGVLEQVVGIYM